MHNRKRKFQLEEIREIFNNSESETEPEEHVTLTVVSMNMCLGTERTENALEKPWDHGLKVYPSKEFFLAMKRYDEIKRDKTVRQDHKNNKISIFILECCSYNGVY